MKKLFMLFILALITILSACSEETEQPADTPGKLSIYTTVYPLKYFAEEIGKDQVQVETIYPPGADEHTFEPSQKDMIKLAESDLFIYIGLGLEGFVNKAKPVLEEEGVNLLAAGENIEEMMDAEEHDHGHENGLQEEEHSDHDHEHGNIDPHVWIDPVYAKQLALAIKEELIKQLPDQKDMLEKNYDDLVKRLDELDQQFQSLAEGAKRKKFIVAHGAYGYWEKRYDLHQISLAGISSAHEPSQKKLQQIIEEAKKENIKYVFIEQNISSKNAEIIQNEIGAKSLKLHNLSVLTEQDIEQNRTYFSIMEDNLKALEKGLNE